MGIWWNLIQQRQINDLQKESNKTDSKTRNAVADSRSLNQKYDQLSLICEAMWEILRDTQGVSETQLLDKVEEIDLRDGNLDGKHNKIKMCNACARKINPQRGNCLFCGNKDIIESAWEKV